MSTALSETDALHLFKQLEEKQRELLEEDSIKHGAEMAAFCNKLMETTMHSLGKSLQTVESSLVERQDTLERNNSARIDDILEVQPHHH